GRRRRPPRRRDVHLDRAAGRPAAGEPGRRHRRRDPVGARAPRPRTHAYPWTHVHPCRHTPTGGHPMSRVLLLDVVGLTPRALRSMPRLSALAGAGRGVRLDTILPAVTCSVQSTILTGVMPNEHGIVGNGWYFRGLGDALLWRQHNTLVTAEKVWE